MRRLTARTGYRRAIAHIAMNDNDGSDERLDVEVLSGYCTVVLVADVFDVDQRQVARDVVAWRRTQDAAGQARYARAVTGEDPRALERLIAGLKKSQ